MPTKRMAAKENVRKTTTSDPEGSQPAAEAVAVAVVAVVARKARHLRRALLAKHNTVDEGSLSAVTRPVNIVKCGG